MTVYDLGEKPAKMEAAIGRRRGPYYPTISVPCHIGLKAGQAFKAVIEGKVREVSAEERNGKREERTVLEARKLTLKGEDAAKLEAKKKLAALGKID